ncbi:MAG: 2-phospho-L-lactate transferase CofD family protein [Nitrososphaeria archaeon]
MKITLMSGGTAGAKMAYGFKSAGADFDVVVNTADDEDVLGLYVSPDFDSVLYSLMGAFDFDRNWGIKDDTFNFFDWLGRYSSRPYIALGDRDLAMHVLRSFLLKQGKTLSEAFKEITDLSRVGIKIYPPSNERLTTMVKINGSELTFEEYFVKRIGGRLESIHIRGSERATASSEAIDAIKKSDVLVIAPSNPLASIYPILSVKGIRDAIRGFKGPRIAISPLRGNAAFKGPANKMMGDLGFEPSPRGVAMLYHGFIDKMVIDKSDAGLADSIQRAGVTPVIFDSIYMKDKNEMSEFARILLSKI